MKKRADYYFLLVIMAIMLAVIFSSMGMDYWASKLLPIAIGTFVLALAVLELAKGIFARDKSSAIKKEVKTGGKDETRASLRGYFLTSLWIVGFFLAVYLFGFVISIPLFLVSYMMLHGVRWFKSIFMAVLVGGIVYVAFDIFLQINLSIGKLISFP